MDNTIQEWETCTNRSYNRINHAQGRVVPQTPDWAQPSRSATLPAPFGSSAKSWFRCICGFCRIRRKFVDTGKDEDFGPYLNDIPRAGTFVHSVDGGRDMVLLVQSYNGKWGPPKGRVEDGETAVECALRETREETGLDLKDLLLAEKPKARILKGKWSMFDAILPSVVQCTPQSDEITGIGWVTIQCISHNKHVLNHPAKLCMTEFMGIRV